MEVREIRDMRWKLKFASRGANRHGLACSIDTIHGEDVLGKIDSNGNNRHEVLLMKELMKRLTSPSWHPVAANRNPYGKRLTRDAEVPFIR